MAQNNIMGGGMAPPPASPANPTALNFQSDPNMRQQFKGFMSGLSNRPMPQPMAQPMPAPMPMYTPAANIDIFAPMPMAMGGAVPRSTEIAGQPHMLSYITPGEAGLLKSMGGAGEPGPGGIPAYFYDEVGAVSGTTGNFGSGGQNQNFDDGGDDDNDDYQRGYSQTYSDGTPAGTTISGNTITGGTIKGGYSYSDVFGPPSGGGGGGDDGGALGRAPVAFGIGPRPRVDLTGPSSPVVDALSNEIGKRSNQTGYDDAPMTSRGMLTNQAQADAAMGLGRGFGASGTTQSVRGAPTARDGSYDEFGFDALNLLGNVDLLDSDAVNRQALDSIARSMQGTYEQVAVNPELTGPAAISGKPIQTPDEIAYNDTMMQTDIAPADVEAIATNIARDKEAQRLAMGGGQVNVDPVTGAVSSIPVPASRPGTLIDYEDPTQISRSVDIASPLSRPGTLIDYDDPTQVPLSGRDLSMASPYDLGEAAGQQVAQGQPSGTAPIERERTEAGRTNRIADSGFGPGEIYRTKGDDLTQDEQNKLIENAMNRRTTVTLGLQDPKFGGIAPPLDTKGAVTVSSLDQLARRAGLSPGSFGGKIAEDLGYFGQLVGNFGAKNAGKMYDNIVNKGHRPVYDNRGQIIATVNSLGQIGAGSRPISMDFVSRVGDDMFDLEGFTYDQFADMQASTKGDDNSLTIADQIRKIDEEVAERSEGLGGIGEAPPQAPSTVQPSTSLSGAAQVANPLQYGYGQIQGINPNLDSAANKFLSFLGGFAEGGEVKKFEKGGSVPRATEIAGQPHMLSYITPGEASILQSLGGSGAPGPGGVPSFFYDEVGAVEGTTGNFGSGGQNQDFGTDDGGDDDNNVSVSSVSPVDPVTNQDDSYTISTDVANQMSQQAKADAEARAALEAANLQQQQMAPQNMIQTQAGTIDPASMSVGEKMSLIGEGLGSLLGGDLFSLTAPEVDADLAARYEAAGFNPETAAYAASGFNPGAAPNLPAIGADLARGGATPQSMAARQGMAPNASVMGYSGPTGQIQTSAANQSIVQTRDPSQAGIAGTMNVPTSRNTGFLDSLSSMVSNLPSRSQIVDRFMGPSDTYDMSRMTSR